LKELLKKFLKNTFYIDLDDSLTYPSSQKICEIIEEYCTDTKQEFHFINKSNPITFSLNGILYETKVDMAHGGYFLLCKEA